MISIKDALKAAADRLHNSDSSRLDAELLLTYVLSESREYLMTWPEVELDENQQRHFDYLVQARLEGQPVAYLIGKRAFWNLELNVTPDVLIPRPETELIVETALELLPRSSQRVADLGTGSGAIALALASERPQWQMIATELSDSALRIANQNTRQLQLENVELIKSDWCLSVNGQLDAIVSNPPYIEIGNTCLQQGDVHFEPRLALIAGRSGLESIEQIINQSEECLKSGGWLILEHGYNQAAAVSRLLEDNNFKNIVTHQDLAGHDRVTAAQRIQRDSHDER